MDPTWRPGRTLGGLTVFLLAVVGAAIAATTLDPLPRWLGGLLAAVAIAGLTLFAATVLRSVRGAGPAGPDREKAAQAATTTCVVVAVAGIGWSLLEAFAGAPRLTGAWATAAVLLTFSLNWSRASGAAPLDGDTPGTSRR
jgi:hypothetical protein